MSKFKKLFLLIDNPYLRYNMMNIRSWVHKYNLERDYDGEFIRVYKKMRKYPAKFFNYTRMSINSFDYLLNKIKEKLERTSTNFREAISAEQRLVITIRFLATGDSFASLAGRFKMGKTTVSEIILDTCAVLWSDLKEECMPNPTIEMWYSVAEKFYEKWNFPNCIDCIDGKHIRIKAPSHSGSTYFNYKQYFSILLQAVVDANRKLIAIDVGTPGRQSDGGNFRTSSLFHLIENRQLNIPDDKCLPHTNTKVSFVLLGDEGYPLLPYLMRPYPAKDLNDSKKIFNYRLSRTRNSVECCFGIMAAKWRLLHKPIETSVEHAVVILKGICILHNYVLEHEGSETNPTPVQNHTYQINDKDMDMTPINHRFSSTALGTRDLLKNYFNSIGAVPWQEDYALPKNIILRHNRKQNIDVIC